MNTTDGALSFEAAIGNSQLAKDIAVIKGQISGLVRNVEKETKGIDAAFENIGKVAAGAFVFNELRQLPAKLIQVRGEFQQLQAAFETMLGSKVAADRLFADVVKFAATTPFDLKGVANGAKQLLAYGVASQDVTATLRRLGDIASGLSIPLGELTYLYGTTRTQGRLFSQDLNQFVGRGIPLIKLLADQFKVAESEVKGLVEQGKVGFPEVEKAINSLTDSGGLFNGLMEKNSKSLTGLYSNFQDTIEQAFNKIGEEQEGLLADSIKFGTAIVQNYEPILDTLKVIVAAYGTYKAAIIATAAIQAVAANQAAISAFISLAASIRSAADAQALFNLVTKANPYVIAATALVTLITAVALFRDTATEAQKAQERLNVELAKADKVDTERKIKVDQLKKAVQDETLSQEERKQKLQELIALSPQHLGAITAENIATKESTKAIEEYIEVSKERMRQQALFDERERNRARLEELRSGKADKEFGPGFLSTIGMVQAQGATGGQFDAQKETQIEIRKQREQQIKELEEYDKKLFDQSQEGIAKRRAQRRKEYEENKADSAKTVKDYEDQIKSLKEAQEKSTSAEGFKNLQKQIDKIDAKRRQITGEVTKEQAEAIKDADKIGPFGSISYWEEVARKAQEVIDKTPAKNTALLTEQTKIKADAEKQAEDIRKQYAIKSFEEEISQKRTQYELYQRWVETYGKQSADKQFEQLVAGNQSYLDYLNVEIGKLKSLADFTTLNENDQGKLDLLNSEKNRVTGAETGIEVFRRNLEETKSNAQSLTDAITELQRVQASLGEAKTGDDFEKRKLVAEQLIDLEKQRKDQLKNFLQEVVGSNQKRLEIEKYYNDLLIELDKQHTDKSSAEYVKGRSDIQKAKEKEIRDQKVALLEESEAYKDLQRVIMSTGVKAIEDKINRTRRAMVATQQALGVESEEYKQLAKQLQDLGIELNRAKAENFAKIVSLAGDLGQALSESNGALGSFGSLLAGAASSAQGLSVVFDDTATKGDKMMAGAQAAVQLISLVIDSAKQRREAELQYYHDVVGQQMQYNLLLNEQIGLQSEINSNVFTNDYQGRLTDGLAQLKDAQQKYQEAIDELNEGLVKQGQRDKVDWGAVGKGAATGAVLGASIGSVIPVIGNAVGAVVGGIVGGVIGLFGGKKKKDEFVGLLAEYPELIQMGADGQERLNTELAKSLLQNNMLDEKTQQLVQNALDWSDAIEKARDQIKGVISELAGALGDNLRNALVDAFKSGTDSAIAFGDSVEQVLEDILSKLIFNAVFKDALDQLEKDMAASSDIGGDGSWIDDFGRFFAQQKELNDKFNSDLESAKEEAKKYGLDIYDKKTENAGATPPPLQGVISGASAESIDLLSGQFNAVRIQVADGVNVARSQLLELTAIRANTGATAVEAAAIRKVLENIDRVLSSDWARAMGGI